MARTLSSALVVVGIILPFFTFGQAPIRIGGGNTGGVQVRSSDQQQHDPETTFDGLGKQPNLSAASRFLGQATLGANYETIVAASQMGYAEWLNNQFETPRAFYLEDLTKQLTATALDSAITSGEDPNRVEPRLHYWHTAWWQYTMTSPDLLRARVALALSEVFVISEVPELGERPLALANYYDMLLDHAFGNYRELLEAITLHPAMGIYLTHVNNPKANPALNRFPDENYAREVMQLFSIGLYMLNPDGSYILDEKGQPVPTYNNENIQELAKVFTGLSFGDNYLFGQEALSEQSYLHPMWMFNSWHEPGAKVLPLGDTIPDRNPVDGMADLHDALDHLADHPNVGPFIGRLLIQRLVKSNPSPEYIARVSAAFADNGNGVRGDLKAVIRAILLDPEARDCYYVNDPWQGMLREPLVRYTQLCRAFNASNEDGLYRNRMDDFYRATFQRPLASPSVFNFFQPDYQPIGPVADNNLVGPEFQITNSVSITGYANLLHQWLVFNQEVMEFRSIAGEDKTDERRIYLDLDEEIEMAENGQLAQVIERFNLVLAHGQLSEINRQLILNTVNAMENEDPEDQLRLALFFIMVSPDYLILK
jgi:uncharacterized protein (DUF1800 family)